jgi:hypothetical protein
MGGDSCLACHGAGEPTNMQISDVDPTKTQTCALCHINVDPSRLSGVPAGGEPPLPLDDIHRQ